MPRALELVVPADIVELIEAWKRVRLCGLATVEVHPVTDPKATMRFYFVDCRARYGVLLGLVVHAEGSLLSGPAGAASPLRPRVSLVRKNGIAEFTELDTAFELLLGYRRTAMLGQRNLELVHPDDHPRALANWLDMLASPGCSRRVRLRQRHRDGHWIWFEVTNHNRLNDPDECCVVAEMIDISDEMSAQESLRASQQLLLRLTETLPVGVLEIGTDRTVVHCSRRVGQILGSDTPRDYLTLFAGVIETDRELLDASITGALTDGLDADVEISARRADGALVRCRLSIRTLIDEQAVPSGAIICLDDVTEQARLREQLEVRATYDALTGCYNRASILAALDRSLADAQQDRTGVAVVFLDLDDFKAINDVRGHAEGDALLKQIGSCLSDALRHNDLVGRVGGDEFLVLSSGISTADQALALGERLAGALARDIKVVPGQAVASIGVGWAAGAELTEPMTADLLVAKADTAMYASKRAGLGQPVLAD